MEEVRNCVICGKLFVARTVNGKYCSEECQTEGLRRRTRNNWRDNEAKKKEIRKSKKKRQKELVDIAVEARKAGMSYGQYVAKMGV